ncbi:MAG: sulfatase [Bryobacterales bacterium]|nr:sulfatase [Bryobacterales bacterium]
MIAQNPSRRDVFRGLAAAGAASASAQQPRMPNVLFVFSDQHRACTMPGEPYNDAETPALARLASQGTTFTHCVSNYPVCSPYRGILMTGRWPYQTGIIDNAYPLRRSEYSLGKAFRDAGYHTGYVGKWHLDARGAEGHALKPEGEARHGFAEWRAWYNTNPHFDRSHTYDQASGQQQVPAGYNATLMTDDAISFIERNKDRPWVLVLSLNPPHPPFGDAPPELMRKYPGGDLQLRPNTGETVTRGIGGRGRSVRRDTTGYNAHVEGVDIEIGRLMACLDRTGLADNSIVVYTSDHGEMLGAHNRTGKRLPHEESCRVPFVARGPGMPAGHRSDALLGAIDLYPTLCGMAGIPVPDVCVGRDLSAIARGAAVDGPEHQFLMHIAKSHASGGVNHTSPIFRGIRTDRYTYACGEIGRWCLYDNQEDPYQLHNLADDASRAVLMGELDGEILDYLGQAEDRFPYRVKRA